MKTSIRVLCAASALVATSLLSGVASADSGNHTCQINEVRYWNIPGQLLAAVHCTTASGTISFFAISVSDAQVANRFVSMMTTALIGKRSIAVTWDQAAAPNVPGCNNSDCRTPRTWSLL